MAYGVISGQIPTPASIGASPTVHTHDASAIVSGILPVAQGGTGTDNLASLLNSLTAEGGVQVFSGTYQGEGTYGSGNRNSLVFESQPKFVMIASTNSTSAIFINPATRGLFLTETNRELIAEWSGNTFSWYATYSEYVQMNSSGTTYTYYAFV